MTKQKLTPKQRLFVSEYMIDMNATKAAIRAGYSSKNADKIGPQLLGKTRISEAIQESIREREKRLEIRADQIDQALANILFLDVRKLFNSDGTPIRLEFLNEDLAGAIAGLDVATTKIDDENVRVMKYKFPDRIRAAELLYRRKGLLNDKLILEGRLKIRRTPHPDDDWDSVPAGEREDS